MGFGVVLLDFDEGVLAPFWPLLFDCRNDLFNKCLDIFGFVNRFNIFVTIVPRGRFLEERLAASW